MMFKRMWAEMFPKPLEEQIEFLHDEALELARRIRARRNQMGLNPEADLAREVQTFFVRVREKDDIIGVATGTRILRHRAAEVFGIDNSARYGRIEDAVAYLDLIVENIEHILDVIDRKRILWWTLATALFAAIAASLAFVTLFFDFVKSTFLHP